MKKIVVLILTITLLLAGAGIPETGTQAWAEEAEQRTDYLIRVVDQYGLPVPGAFVNICTDTTCMPSLTDENGEILFDGEPMAYHLQVLKVPEGFSCDPAEESWTEAEYSEAVITVAREIGSDAVYVLTVEDQNGDPVEDVEVNICTTTFCETRKSNAEGKIVYIVEPAIYIMKIASVPEGCRFDSNKEYYTEPRSSEMKLQVSREH
ncbi:MAG: hypothetical protein IJL88_00650 [Clostridia bacterium]|nr:hypothetical protein [Clostridia bacterium]